MNFSGRRHRLTVTIHAALIVILTLLLVTHSPSGFGTLLDLLAPLFIGVTLVSMVKMNSLLITATFPALTIIVIVVMFAMNGFGWKIGLLIGLPLTLVIQLWIELLTRHPIAALPLLLLVLSASSIYVYMQRYTVDLSAVEALPPRYEQIVREGYSLDDAPSVDASKLTKQWSLIKQWQLGYNVDRIPLRGIIRMPAREQIKDAKRLPLALIVHGNHVSSVNSADGYTYLLTALAKQGFIAVSIDETMLNYTPFAAEPQPNIQLRAWLVNEHVRWLTQSSPYAELIDSQQIVLIGHSRGGEAVALAAESSPDVRVRAVVAIAPTGILTPSRLGGASYLLIQGDHDADVTRLHGNAQYSRLELTESGQHKAQVIIGHANHSQFNERWGSYDQALPVGLVLNRLAIMPAEAQRTLAQSTILHFLQGTMQSFQTYMQRIQRSEVEWFVQAHRQGAERVSLSNINVRSSGYFTKSDTIEISLAEEGQATIEVASRAMLGDTLSFDYQVSNSTEVSISGSWADAEEIQLEVSSKKPRRLWTRTLEEAVSRNKYTTSIQPVWSTISLRLPEGVNQGQQVQVKLRWRGGSASGKLLLKHFHIVE